RRADRYVVAADIKQGSNWHGLADKYPSNFSFILGDFCNSEAFELLDKDFDEIYMLAAVVGVNRTIKEPHEVIRINTKLTTNVLEWVAKNPVNKILFSSSSENYAATTDLYDSEVPTRENIPLCIGDITHPRWTYAITKMLGESAFIHSSEKLNYDYRIVRYQNIIGPEMGFGHAIPHIVERFVNKIENPMKIYGHDQTRAFCYIDDAVNGTVRAMESANHENNIYHIGNDRELSMEELTKFIGSLLGYVGPYENAMTYPGSVSRRCPNIAKAVSNLSYNPKVNWRDTVTKTVEWYKDFFESGAKPTIGGFEPPEDILGKQC
ncbi:NAD(P)-dependent oxidoreductase, partial [Opitutales bacterium]|nr:NAD(P)-dependent oxidoreductase [Opitutales bacterium]